MQPQDLFVLQVVLVMQVTNLEIFVRLQNPATCMTTQLHT